MKKIGLSGSMGTGKSSVIEMLRNEGITVLDCDVINAQLLQQGEAGYQALLDVFGMELLDAQGNIEKQKMSSLIFSDAIKKQQVEHILHPLIKTRIMEELQHHIQEALVVVEVPLLFEVHWETFFDEVWVVACDEEILLDRLQQFRHVSREEAKRRLSHQLPQNEKTAKASVVFYNNSDKENLREQICAILKAYRRADMDSETS